VIFQILREAGLPDGVVNFLPGSGATVGDPVMASPHLSGLHFTGSTEVFCGLWSKVGAGIRNYRNYPRIVGETGGKDFIFAHPSAHKGALVTAIVRGAFEYQGQKCSAASRIFVPSSLWKQIKDDLIQQTRELPMGDPTDFGNFLGAVIDRGSFQKIAGYVERARASADADVIAGGECDDAVGYFIQPTLVLAKDPRYESMCEEIFGPVASVYVYPDEQLDLALQLCDEGSPYALTGAVLEAQPPALDDAAHHQGDLRPAHPLSLSPHGLELEQLA
jgi:1-pyrroline-5-carboxylate dehydrogenase